MEEVQVIDKDEHLPLEPTIAKEKEESPDIQSVDTANKKQDGEEVQIDMDESNATSSCFDRLCCFSKCACFLSCFLAISHFMKAHSTLGELAFQISGLIMYIFDVGSDFASGDSLISGPEIDFEKFGNYSFTNYTEIVCANLIDYSHPMWGWLNIALAWLPGVTLVPALINEWRFDMRDSCKYKIHWAQKCLILSIVVIFWPIIGFLL